MIILGTNSIKDTGFDVANSCRFNSASDDYLNRTPSSSGNRKTWTFSTWFKKCKLGVQQRLFSVQESGDERLGLYFSTSDQIVGELRFGGEGGTGLYTTQLFRDMSAWYHVVWSVDTTQSTNTNRAKLYINGEQITSFSESGYPTQNANTATNYTVEHRIGKSVGFNNPLDGYMAETVLIDGQALDPTSFGEFDEDSGIWKPIDVSGLTFGTNGFYLDFENSGSLGADVSGNGNNFTVNNLTSIDQSTDTCTLNYATLNNLDKNLSNVALSEGNLKMTTSATNVGGRATMGVSSGKWFWEVKIEDKGSNVAIIGIAQPTNWDLNYVGSSSTSYGYSSGAEKYNNTSSSSYGASWTTNDIIGVALNMDDGEIAFYKNGSSQGTAYTGIPTTDFMLPAFSGQSGTDFLANFGSPPYAISSGNTDGNGYGNFEYAVPSGYYALNTKNLAEYG